jgi:hypothetical protein
MYNAHRGMVPAPTNRLNELLDQLRAEFESQANRTQEYDQQSKLYFRPTSLYFNGRVVVSRWVTEIDGEYHNLHTVLRPVCKGAIAMSNTSEDGACHSVFYSQLANGQCSSDPTNARNGNGQVESLLLGANPACYQAKVNCISSQQSRYKSLT